MKTINQLTFKNQAPTYQKGFLTMALVCFLLLSHTVFSYTYPEKSKLPKVTSSYDCAPPALSMASIQPVKSGLWTEAATWPGGIKPTINDDIVIPSGITLTMVGTCRARNIRINGTLNAVKGRTNGVWIDLKAQSIVVANNGLLEIGTEAQPYISDVGPTGTRCQITLTGATDRDRAKNDSSYKAILVQNGGTLELHGKRKTSWTNLSTTANKGATQITLKEAVSWEVGDIIALTSTELARKINSKGTWEYVDQAEITNISGNGRTITLKNPLQYKHIGGSKSYTRSKDGKTWNVNIQAEVGLLSHYIKIQGETSDTDGFGGHIMMMINSKSHAEHVELFRMGQKGLQGRYPFHWHLAEDKSKGSYLKNSSIHKSFNRAVTIHGTDEVTVDGVFAYDHIGHGIFLEDGTERYNNIKNNVVFVTRRPTKADRLTPSDQELDQVQNRTPSSYWITNPNNNFENNVAAGTEGTGFWFAFPESPLLDTPEERNNPHYKNIIAWKEPLGNFDGFVAHTCMNGWDVFDRLNPDHSLKRNFGWDVKTRQLIKGGLLYGNDQAIYSGLGVGGVNKNTVFYDCAFTDNKTVTMLAGDLTIENSLFNVDTDLGVFSGTREFFRFYDGPGRHFDCHFEGWNRSNAEMIKQIEGGGATENFNPSFRGTTKGFSEPFRFRFTPIVDEDSSAGRKAGQFFKDLDGSMLGTPGTLIRDYAFLRDGTESRDPSWKGAAKVDYFFAGLWLNKVQKTGANIAVQRTKPGTPSACLYNAAAESTLKFPMIVNEGFTYNYYFDRAPSSKSINAIWYRGSAGDLGLACFKGFAKLGGLKVGGKKVNSKAQVEAAKENSYFIDENDVYVMFKSREGDDRTAVNISWSNNGSFKAATLPCTKNDFSPGTTTNPTNIPPSVSFENPNQNQYEEGADLAVVANASDTDGSIANVRLFLNDVLVRQENGAPYEWGDANTGANDTALLNLSAGTYVLKAVATDNGGLTGTTTKTITVGNSGPTTVISFQSPDNKSLNEGDSLDVVVSVDTGSVSNIRLYINDVFVRQENITPYEWGTNDTALQNFVAGDYELKAVATSTNGETITKTTNISVIRPNQPPTVNLTSPGNGASFDKGQNVTLSTNASDSDGNITKIDFYANNSLISSVTNASQSTTTSFSTTGAYEIYAIATDNDGDETQSTSININIVAPDIPTSTNDTDGDGKSDVLENEICGNPNNASDLNFAFSNTNEGFELRNINADNTNSDVYWLLRADNSNDPFVIKNGLRFKGNQVPQLKIRVKSEATGSFQLFWATTDQPGFAAARSLTVVPQTTNVFEELVFDMSGLNTWMEKTITRIRLDFPPDTSARRHTFIDYIHGPNASDEGCINPTPPVVEPSGNPIVHITKANAPEFALDGNFGGANGQNVYLWEARPNNENQQWEEIDRGNGYYSYIKLNTDFCLDSSNGSNSGQNVRLWTYNENYANQQWKKIVATDGSVRLEKRYGSTISLNGGSGGANRQNVFMDVNNATGGNQQWIIEVVGRVPESNKAITGASAKDVTVYPNPTTTDISVAVQQSGGVESISILNIQGQLIKTVPFTGSPTMVDLSELSNGMYFVQLNSDSLFEIVKVVKK